MLILTYAEVLGRRLLYHMYADEMQGHQHSQPGDRHTALQNTVTDVKEWCLSKRLQLNATRTELLWWGTATNLRKLPPADKFILTVSTVTEPVPVVRDLGVYFDSELMMRELVSHVTWTCFFRLRRLRMICQQLGHEVTSRLVSALVLSHLDYCNAVFANLPGTIIEPLQRVRNAAARLILNLWPRNSLTAAFLQLHWLPV
jgi:hypothetical protein